MPTRQGDNPPEELQHVGPTELPSNKDPPISIDPVNLENILG
jgi:hypothetical protein